MTEPASPHSPKQHGIKSLLSHSPSSSPKHPPRGFKYVAKRARVKSLEQFKVFAHRIAHPSDLVRSKGYHERELVAPPPEPKQGSKSNDREILNTIHHLPFPTPRSSESGSSTSASEPYSYKEAEHIDSSPRYNQQSYTAPSAEEDQSILIVQKESIPYLLDTVIMEQIEGRATNQHEELDAPDPFVVDDDDSQTESTCSLPSARDSPIADTTPSPLVTSQILEGRAVTPTPITPQRSTDSNVNKPMPPPPPSDSSDEDEEDTPSIVLPIIVAPTNFLPIPNTDPLSTLLSKYIHPPELRPHRDLSGDWQRTDFHTLVMTNSWRALARMARDRLISADPEDLPLVLGLWYLRLASLARLRLFNQTAAECTNLFNILNSISPPSAKAYLFERLLPFELEVMQLRLKYWGGDMLGHLEALTALLAKCRARARSTPPGDAATIEMWKERGARVVLMMASQLLEMKDYMAAVSLLEPLCESEQSNSTLRSAIGRIYLQAGYLSMADMHFTIASQDDNCDESQKKLNAALLACAKGNWDSARSKLTALVEQDAENFAAVNNLAVVLLSQGKIAEAIGRMEQALQSSPSSVVVAEPFLFNLSTLYELRSATSIHKKRSLLVEVAKWSGDGLKTTCLKMPAN